MERLAVADEVIDAPEIITKHWGLILQESVWNIVLSWIDAGTPAGKIATGFALSSEGTIRTKAGKPRELLEVSA